jgi:hypothetical protein
MTNPTMTITIRSPNAAIGLRSRGIHHQIHQLMTNQTYYLTDSHQHPARPGALGRRLMVTTGRGASLDGGVC